MESVFPPVRPIGNFMNDMRNYRTRFSNGSIKGELTTSAISETLEQVTDTISSYLGTATERLYETLSSNDTLISSVFNTVSSQRLRRYVSRRHKAKIFRENYFRRSHTFTRRELRRSSSDTVRGGLPSVPRLDLTNTEHFEESICEINDSDEGKEVQAPARQYIGSEKESPILACKAAMSCKSPNVDRKGFIKLFNSDDGVGTLEDHTRRSQSVSEYTVLDDGSILTSNECNTLEKAYVKLKIISKNSDKGFLRLWNTSPHKRRRFSVKQSSTLGGQIKPDLETVFGKLQFVVHPNKQKTVRITINEIQIFTDTGMQSLTDDSNAVYYYYIKLSVDNGNSSVTTRKKKMAVDGYVSFRETVTCRLSIVDIDYMGAITFFVYKKKKWSPFETPKCVAEKKVYFNLNSDCLRAEVYLDLHQRVSGTTWCRKSTNI